MNVDPTLTREDFSRLHNALCELRRIERGEAQAVNPDSVSTQLAQVIAQFETALADAYRQDRAAFDRQQDHYHQVAQDQRITHSLWSVAGVDNLHEPHPFDGARSVQYSTHWGAGVVSAEIQGDTWLDLWLAADSCILQSGDRHHCYIERFDPIPNSDFELNLVTGS